MPLSSLHIRKKRTNLAILGALCAWVVLIFIVSVVRMMPAASAPVESDYAVNPAYQECVRDSDCTLASTTCNGCCTRDAINTVFVERYQQERETYCSGYKGSVCECRQSSAHPKCQVGRCVLVPTLPTAPSR